MTPDRAAPVLRTNESITKKTAEKLLPRPLDRLAIRAALGTPVVAEHAISTLLKIRFVLENDGKFILTKEGRAYARAPAGSRPAKAVLSSALLSQVRFVLAWRLASRKGADIGRADLSRAIAELHGIRPATSDWYASFALDFAKKAGLVLKGDRFGTYRPTRLLQKAGERLPTEAIERPRDAPVASTERGGSSDDGLSPLATLLLDVGALLADKEFDPRQAERLSERASDAAKDEPDPAVRAAIEAVADLLTEGVTSGSRDVIARSFRLLYGFVRRGAAS